MPRSHFAALINLFILFYSGTSGIVLPFNKAQFPTDFKDKSRLQYYASLFNSIEINSTFYKLPKPATVFKWAESVPPNFRFTFKAPRSITHAPKLNFELLDVFDFMRVVNQVGEMKGCLLAQFPPSLTIEDIKSFVTFLQIFEQHAQSAGWQLAIEFRNTSWDTPKVYELLRHFKASMVLHDMIHSPMSGNPTNADFAYFRFHGPEPRYRGSYSEKFIKECAQFIKRWHHENKPVYAYYNNTLGDAFRNLQTLNEFVYSHSPTNISR